MALPDTMIGHKKLEVLLLDNNLFIELPIFLCTLPNLRVLGFRQNLIDIPR